MLYSTQLKLLFAEVNTELVEIYAVYLCVYILCSLVSNVLDRAIAL